jgi:hypothetical protein
MDQKSWNRNGCQVGDALLLQLFDAMVTSRLKAAVYQFINSEDCWEGQYDGRLHPTQYEISRCEGYR